jgi:hypothetical protein
MEIRILNGGCGREINAAVMASALISGCKLTSSSTFVRFEVCDWSAFLHLYWNGAAEFSKAFAANSASTRMHVLVVDDKGRQFQTDVWYSVEHKGVHYVSLY